MKPAENCWVCDGTGWGWLDNECVTECSCTTGTIPDRTRVEQVLAEAERQRARILNDKDRP